MSRSTPENRIKKQLDTMLKEERVWFFPPQSGPYGHAGIPDRVACVLGRFVGIECKADASNKPTALQELCAERIRASGGAWFLVYDTDTIEQVRGFIHDCRRASQSTGTKA